MTLPMEEEIYELSDRLGVEIYLLGVGDRIFLPHQQATPFSTETIPQDTIMVEWVVEALERTDQEVWWLHTHPGMPAFFSKRDVLGAHNLWDAVGRPFRAVVLGAEGQRYEVIIDEDWVEKNPLVTTPLRNPQWDKVFWEPEWDKFSGQTMG